jgi:hypothetical protein
MDVLCASIQPEAYFHMRPMLSLFLKVHKIKYCMGTILSRKFEQEALHLGTGTAFQTRKNCDYKKHRVTTCDQFFGSDFLLLCLLIPNLLFNRRWEKDARSQKWRSNINRLALCFMAVYSHTSVPACATITKIFLLFLVYILIIEYGYVRHLQDK